MKGIYRGKRKDNLQWVVGYYLKFGGCHFILPENNELLEIREAGAREVIPETVCRGLERHPCYDGCYDNEGKRFFQNDILAVWKSLHANIDTDEPDTTAVVIDECTVSENGLGCWFPQDTTRVKVIGNAYDNPELLQPHDMNHFVNRLNEYDGDDYSERHRHLTGKYGIHGAQACCYLCNFENDYICNQYNGGCKRRDVCYKIRDDERKQEE